MPQKVWKQTELVLNVFRSHPNQYFDAAGIARELQLLKVPLSKRKVPTIRAVIQQLFSRRRLERIERGLYQLNHAMEDDDQFEDDPPDVELGSGDVFKDVKANAPRWSVIIAYIDGSMTGFPINELSTLAEAVEDGPDFNLIETIEIKMMNRLMIGTYKKTE